MENLSFDESVDLFTTYCKSKGLAERTLQTYTFALEGLRNFLACEADPSRVPDSGNLRAYIAHMLERGLARGTIRVRMRSIRVYCNFLAREGIVGSSPMARVDIPKVPFKFPEVLSEMQAKQLLRATKRATWTGVRNRAMIMTFLDTGIRLGEMVQLDLEDINLRSRSLRIRNGKGSKERQVYIGMKLFRALRRWIEIRGDFLPESPAFMTRKGERLDIRNVERIIERAAHRAKLNGTRVTPHILRHTFATHFIKNGGDPFSLQRILGHSDIKTTMIYVNLAGVDLKEAHAKASPVDRLLGR